MKVSVRCNTCGKEFLKEKSEYNRQMRLKDGKAKFYCCKDCMYQDKNFRRSNPILTKICPICNSKFQTKQGCKEATFCSRSCASKGSVNQNRINAGKNSIKNFPKGNVKSIQHLLKIREGWKYRLLKNILEEKDIEYEFEYIIGDFIFDLALFQYKILFEFDGKEHKTMDESLKENAAKQDGWKLIRIEVDANTEIEPVKVFDVINSI